MITLKPTDPIIRHMLADEETQALVLLTILLYLHGPAVFGDENTEAYDPAELWAATYDATGIWLSEEAENKVNAIMMAVTSDDFYVDDITFASIANALYDGDLGDLVNGIFEKPSMVEVLWAASEVELAREEEEGPPIFGPKVRYLIEEIAQEESMPLDDAEAEVEHAIYKGNRVRSFGTGNHRQRKQTTRHRLPLQKTQHIKKFFSEGVAIFIKRGYFKILQGSKGWFYTKQKTK